MIVDRYNNERQEGKYCPGLSPKDAFEKFHGEEPRVRLNGSCRHLLATHKMRVRSGRNGISFRFGREQFTYKSRETGELRGQELFVWFNVENPSSISVTNDWSASMIGRIDKHRMRGLLAERRSYKVAPAPRRIGKRHRPYSLT